MIRAICCLSVAWALAACGGRTQDRAGFVVRDSAGVTIVENASPKWEGAEGWRLSANSTLTIGGDSDDPAQQLYRVGNALRLTNGHIMLVNRGTNTIRVYDASGRFVSSFGREGGGPGEFQEIGSLRPFRGDSFLIYDTRLRRLSVFDRGGQFGRSFSLEPPSGLALAFYTAPFIDGSLLGSAGQGQNPTGLSGLVRPERRLFRFTDDGTQPEPLGVFPGNETFYQELFGGGVDFRPPLFGKSSHVTNGPDYFFVAVTDRYEIKRYTLEGRLEAIWRVQREPDPVTSDDVDFLLQERLRGWENDENAQRQIRQAFRNLSTADNMPAFGSPAWEGGVRLSLAIDRLGNVWIVDHYKPAEWRNTRTVLSSEGEWLGRITLPERFTPTHIGADFVLGRWTDDLDVEYVLLYDLIKPEQ